MTEDIVTLDWWHREIKSEVEVFIGTFEEGSLFKVCYFVFYMGTKIKGVFKSFKFISQIFVVKEREMEIGYPTDVKHVAHIGWDGSSGNAPSWMNEFKTAPDFAATSIANTGSVMSTWSSQDFGEAMGRRPTDDTLNDLPPVDLPDIPKKQRRRKSKSTSSPKSASSSKSSSRVAKVKANTETM
ncbi:hypothetical protein QVD17_17904 [Tagetes erecta]|uniref:CRIB domain-containing protein n=1 Tax=Tagetes erecta TaxID=13708 RepID=A0AAD8KH57_TARER|nr:hypothetical protein QVD17_17904 [Tagetes erecta]